MRFIADDDGTFSHGVGDAHKKANVVMVVAGLLFAWWNPVHVDVKDALAEGFDALDTGFFAGFADGGREYVGLTINMSAELQPFVELAVVSEQRSTEIATDDPRRTGDVARFVGSLEARGGGSNEVDDSISRLVLVRVEGSMLFQQLQ